MRISTRNLTFLLLFSASILRGQLDSVYWKESAHVKAIQLEIAFKMRDYRYYAELNHPKIVEMLGGKDKFVSVLSDQMKQVEEEVKIDSIDFGLPFNFSRCDSVVNCLLAQTMFMRLTDTMAMRSTIYLIGHSEDFGREWYFFDASNGAQLLDIVAPKRCKTLAVLPPEREFFNPEKTKK